MDLNFPLSDTNSEGDAPPLSTIGSVHPRPTTRSWWTNSMPARESLIECLIG